MRIKASFTSEVPKHIKERKASQDWLKLVEQRLQVEVEILFNRYALLGSIQIEADKEGESK